MQEIKNKNEQERSLKSYEWSSNFSLYDCYAAPSYNKVKAMEYCKELMKKYNGYGLKILGYNILKFRWRYYK